MLTNCGQDFQNFYHITVNTVKFLIIKILCFVEQLQPILGFVGFFQRYFHFGNKVGCALCSLCFCNIGTDTGSAFIYLLGNNIFFLLFCQMLLKVYNSYQNARLFLIIAFSFMEAASTICNLSFVIMN